MYFLNYGISFILIQLSLCQVALFKTVETSQNRYKGLASFVQDKCRPEISDGLKSAFLV